MKKIISIIVTCRNEQDNLKEMYKRIQKVFKKLPSYSYEILFVDNDSTDSSLQIYTDLAKQDKKVKVLCMSRNFGSPQPSFLAGLTYSQGMAAVLLHGDIQDPPELIPLFIKEWEKGSMVVYGVRATRHGLSFVMNFLYKAFYWIFSQLSYVKAPLNAGDFSLLDRRVITELLSIDEYDYYLRFLRAYVGFPQIGISYERDAREHGRSEESIVSSFMWAKAFIVNFSFKPLEWISMLAFVVTVGTVFLFIANFIVVILHPGAPRGVPTIVLLILFLGAIQLLSLSVIAEYLAKIFLEVKHRPRYIIKKTLNIKNHINS
jgi:polyisoprenyl-phosphate glycosyltransferase